MNKKRFAALLLPALLCISGQALSAEANGLTVTGKIKPGGCSLSLTGGGKVTVNAIWDELHADGTLLPTQTIGMNIGCADNTLMRVTVTDPMAESKIAYDEVRKEAWSYIASTYPSRRFGLGSVGGKKLGAFQIYVRGIELSWNTAGGVNTGPGSLYDIDSDNRLGPDVEGTYALTTAYGTAVGNAFSNPNRVTDPLRAVKTVSADLNIYPTINKTGSLPRQDVINLNGQVNFELFIL